MLLEHATRRATHPALRQSFKILHSLVPSRVHPAETIGTWEVWRDELHAALVPLRQSCWAESIRAFAASLGLRVIIEAWP